MMEMICSASDMLLGNNATGSFMNSVSSSSSLNRTGGYSMGKKAEWRRGRNVKERAEVDEGKRSIKWETMKQAERTTEIGVEDLKD